ncbi:MAG: hypothetical protein AB1649_08880 [Chloroflexota bacterium]
MDKNPSNRNKRLAFMLSGIMDASIGAALLLIGFGILPVNIGLQNWVLILIGGVMAVAGATMAIYNFSRLDE